MSEGAPLSRPSPPLTGGEGDSPRAWGPSLRTGRRRFVAPKRAGKSSPRREKSPEGSEGGGSRRGSPQRSRSSATREGDGQAPRFDGPVREGPFLGAGLDGRAFPGLPPEAFRGAF